MMDLFQSDVYELPPKIRLEMIKCTARDDKDLSQQQCFTYEPGKVGRNNAYGSESDAYL